MGRCFLALMLAAAAALCSGPVASFGAKQTPSVAPTSAAASMPSPSPATSVEDAFRFELAAALKAFEPTLYLFCFGVDEAGKMPRD